MIRKYSYEVDSDEDELTDRGVPPLEDEGEQNDSLLQDLRMLSIFRNLADQGEDVAGEISQDQELLSQELAKIQAMLQSGMGSDDSWTAALQSNNFAMVDYFLRALLPPGEQTGESALSPSSSFSLGVAQSDNAVAAARCLAFAGNVYRRLWVDYTADFPELYRIFDVALIVVDKLRQLVVTRGEVSAAPLVCSTYLGFDERDVKEFNLVGYVDESLGHKAGGRRNSTHGIIGMESTDDDNASIMVLLLLLFQFFSERNPLITARLRGTSSSNSTAADHILVKFVEISKFLLLACAEFSEDSYLQCIKVIAAINRQFPVSCAEDDARRKLLPIYCRGDFDAQQVSQGLLHILNDVGYPSHLGPETMPILQCCIDLMNQEDFFYSNDINVMADIILRELQNMTEPVDTDDCGTNPSAEEEIRVMYIRLLGALLLTTSRIDTLDRCRKELLLGVLHTAVGGGSSHQWSGDEARKVLDFLS